MRVLRFEATTRLSAMLHEVLPWVEAAVSDGRI